jgi:hypothetical protein
MEVTQVLLFEEAVTGIEEVEAEEILKSNKKVYDLKGNLVNPTLGGVYIIDGVKVRVN